MNEGKVTEIGVQILKGLGSLGVRALDFIKMVEVLEGLRAGD